VGERALGGKEFFEEHKGRFWGIVHTRPYMRVRDMLGEMLVTAGRVPEAISQYEALLELNPNDSQGNRYYLLGCYLHETNLAGVERLFAQFKDEGSTFFKWGRVLERFLAGDRKGAARMHTKARTQNPHVERLLSGRVKPSSYEGYYVPGEESEAAQVIATQGLAWLKHTAALAWLEDGSPATTEQEREQSLASYAPPVSALLTMGRPKRPWEDYCALGLTQEHVLALLRMATDAGLHEADKDPDYFAPVHAWRALAQLRAEEAIEPLVQLLQEYEHDDWTGEELPQCLALFGPAALKALSAFLANDEHSEFPRINAAHSIQEIGAKHPESRGECVRLLVGQLQHYEENDASLNGFLVSYLLDLKAVEALPLIEQAFEADAVDEEVAGDFEDVRAELEKR
jgi:HEAT repeat protein